jgi:hypothetical protein
MRFILKCVFLIVSLIGSRSFADDSNQEEKLRLIYKDGVFTEAFGQTDGAQSSFRRVAESGIQSSKYVEMAREKLCHFDKLCVHSSSEHASVNLAQTRKLAELKALLLEVDDVDISIVNDRIVVDGVCDTVRDLERVKSVVAIYNQGEVVSLVRVSPNYPKRVAQIIYNDINLPDVQIRAVDQTLILEGVVLSIEVRERAEKIAETYAKSLPGSKVVDFLQIAARTPANTSAKK